MSEQYWRERCEKAEALLRRVIDDDDLDKHTDPMLTRSLREAIDQYFANDAATEPAGSTNDGEVKS